MAHLLNGVLCPFRRSSKPFSLTLNYQLKKSLFIHSFCIIPSRVSFRLHGQITIITHRNEGGDAIRANLKIGQICDKSNFSVLSMLLIAAEKKGEGKECDWTDTRIISFWSVLCIVRTQGVIELPKREKD